MNVSLFHLNFLIHEKIEISLLSLKLNELKDKFNFDKGTKIKLIKLFEKYLIQVFLRMKILNKTYHYYFI